MRKTISTRELATYYFPNCKIESATHQLRSFIVQHPKLHKKLLRANYCSHQRGYTQRQVDCIKEWLG